ncbi:hypothetical protein H9Q13_01015 [Pontibacter sp. JH31]|uniref:Uncharacterized protein n=1 Tax=Pontibacter aquaedesilientis TaxID=2766980 RepID=A0ABR7XBP7_9BACT|nr:hypothetical protein [Pontibacter aquaedesilientis]MBD1395732.1 hypothetical protein [Pontibacter aquaedesilientis]
MNDNKEKHNANQKNNPENTKQDKDNPRQQKGPQSTHANLATTSRGADSTDKEFRNDQPNPSTVTDPDMKSKKGNS